jgi:glucose-6-phosphate isomerase
MSIKELFERDSNRAKKLSRTLDLGEGKLHFDFSKSHLTEEIVDEYLEKVNRFSHKIEDMFRGRKINYTEDRPVLHVALRDKDVLDRIGEKSSVELSGEKRDVYDELLKIKGFVEEFESGKVSGVTNKRFDTVVNIGIGGSDLGPRMACDALSHYRRKGVEVHFISNIDATETIRVFERIDPETTLFIVVSKTFTTLETMKNAGLALRYMAKRLGRSEHEIANRHFVAISSNLREVEKFNIPRTFAMWDFVGGRYSLWSAVGISIALYIGFENFLELLRGASITDGEFLRNRGRDNIEIMHAVLELFYSERDYNNKCLVPYDQYLEKLHLYLQQAEMESNGKASARHQTGMIIWGGVGTNSQHSFFQLLHQGTRKILAEFLMPLEPLHNEREYHQMLVSNCLAQSKALMTGWRSTSEQEHFEGNRPTVTICYSRLCPRTLGALLAHYEHKIFVMGLYWEINSFDQFGVTLGKKVATELLESIRSGQCEGYDPSTNELLRLLENK